MKRGLVRATFSLLILGGNFVSAAEQNPAEAPDDILSCGEFSTAFSFFQNQHLRFFIDQELKISSAVSEALKNTPSILKDMGYVMLSALFEKNLLPQLHEKSALLASTPQQLCDSLQTSLYRAVFLKSFARNLDPYSDFFLTEELEIRSSVVDGEFVGVGIGTDPKGDYLEVNFVVEEGPASEKLFVGDKIFRIDGHPIKGLGELEIRQRIRGTKGTIVKFEIERNQEKFAVEITRDRVQQKSVTAQMVDNRYLMIKIQRFYRQTPFEVEAALRAHASLAKGVILDLRNNPGGLLQAARDLVDLFVSSGVVVYLRGRHVSEEVWALNEGGYLQIPLVVLVNEGTASAAEIVAGALQDYHRAIVVGRKTYGKGSVQNVYETQSALNIPYRGGFKLTTMLYYLPSGRNVDRLEPDLMAAATEGDEVMDHPQMPFRGPDKIPVLMKSLRQNSWSAEKARNRFSNLFQGHQAGDASATSSTEELGKALMRMLATNSY